MIPWRIAYRAKSLDIHLLESSRFRTNSRYSSGDVAFFAFVGVDLLGDFLVEASFSGDASFAGVVAFTDFVGEAFFAGVVALEGDVFFATLPVCT
jgi:hypothetical protein